jgi:hypothetical protein
VDGRADQASKQVIDMQSGHFRTLPEWSIFLAVE